MIGAWITDPVTLKQSAEWLLSHPRPWFRTKWIIPLCKKPDFGDESGRPWAGWSYVDLLTETCTSSAVRSATCMGKNSPVAFSGIQDKRHRSFWPDLIEDVQKSTTDEAEWASATKMVGCSNLKSTGHLGGRRQLAVARLVAICNLLKLHVVLCHSKF